MNTPSTLLRAALRRPCNHVYTLVHSNSCAVQSLHQLRRRPPHRPVHTTRPLHAPERPTVLTNMLASDVPPPVQVTSVGSEGIKLADGLVLTGPALFVEGKVLLWDVPNIEKGNGGVSSWSEWTRAHWEVFQVLVPKPEILIFGTGTRMELVPSSIRGYMKELGIQVEVMDTKNACSTYNLLAEEGRRVAAALLPIKPTTWTRKVG